MHGPPQNQPGFPGALAPSPQEQLLLSEKEKQIRELQQRLALQQQNEAEIQRQIERAEMARLQNQ